MESVRYRPQFGGTLELPFSNEIGFPPTAPTVIPVFNTSDFNSFDGLYAPQYEQRPKYGTVDPAYKDFANARDDLSLASTTPIGSYTIKSGPLSGVKYNVLRPIPGPNPQTFFLRNKAIINGVDTDVASTTIRAMAPGRPALQERYVQNAVVNDFTSKPVSASFKGIIYHEGISYPEDSDIGPKYGPTLTDEYGSYDRNSLKPSWWAGINNFINKVF